MTEAYESRRHTAIIRYMSGGKDEQEALWLRRELEACSLPVLLAPDAAGFFRPGEEGAAHADLDPHASLIVILSPCSAGSSGLAADIRWFVEAGQEDRVIPLWLAGGPPPVGPASVNAASSDPVPAGSSPGVPPSTGETPAVSASAAPVSSDPAIAAFRRFCPSSVLPAHIPVVLCSPGGRDRILPAVLARLLRLDERVVRECRRRVRQRRMTGVLALSLAFLAVLSGLVVWAFFADQRVVAQRDEAEELVEFLVRDLSEESFGSIPPHDRQRVAARVESYYRRQEHASSDTGRLYRARHLEYLAEDARLNGAYPLAREHLGQAGEIMDALLRRAPEDKRLIGQAHSLALALFKTARDQGDVAVARSALDTSLDLAQRHAALEGPADADAVAVGLDLMARTHESAAVFAWEQGDQEESLRWSREALATRERQRALAPSNQDAAIAYSRDLQVVCDRLGPRDFSAAERLCEQSLKTAEGIVRSDPFDLDAQERLLQALNAMAGIRFSQLRLKEAEDYSRQALDKAKLLAAHEPDDARRQSQVGAVLALRADILRLAGEISPAEASSMLGAAGVQVAGAAAQARGTAMENKAREVLAHFRDRQADLERAPTEKDRLLAPVIQARKQVASRPEDARSLRALADALRYAFIHLRDSGSGPEALALAREAREAFVQYRLRMPSDLEAALDYCDQLSSLGRLVRDMGENEEARTLFQESLTVAERLAKDNPHSGEALAALADACDELGETLAAQGYCEAAHEYFLRVLAVSRSFAEKGEAAPLNEARLALALQTAGLSFFRLGESDAGLALLREALEHSPSGRATGEEPTELTSLANMTRSESAALLGQHLASLGRTDEGLALIEEGLALARQGVRQDPEAWRHVLVARLQQAAFARSLREERDKALEVVQELLPLAARDAEQPAESLTALLPALSALNECAAILADHGRSRDILPTLDKVLSRIGTAPPADAYVAFMQALLLRRQAEALLAAGQAGAALAACDEGLRVITPLTERSPKEADWALARAALLGTRADMLLATGDVPAAFDFYARSLDGLRRLYGQEPRRLEGKKEFLRVLRAFSAAAARDGQKTRARELSREAEAIE